MALTANITTPDGVEHPACFARVYPITVQTLPGDYVLSMTLHCWCNAQAQVEGRRELEGFPLNLRLQGEAAETALVTCLGSLATVSLPGDPVGDAMAIKDALVDAIEAVVVAEDSRFSRIPSLGRN